MTLGSDSQQSNLKSNQDGCTKKVNTKNGDIDQTIRLFLHDPTYHEIISYFVIPGLINLVLGARPCVCIIFQSSEMGPFSQLNLEN